MICPGCILAGIAVWYIFFWDRTKAWLLKMYIKIKGEKHGQTERIEEHP